MLTASSWILIAIAAIVIILGILAIILTKKRKHKPDYYSLFIMGAIWLPFGAVMSITNPESTVGFMFLILGLIYFIVGLSHKKEWKKNHKTLKQMSKQERKLKIIIMAALLALLIAGAVLLILYRKGIL